MAVSSVPQHEHRAARPDNNQPQPEDERFHRREIGAWLHH
jgi:hypothetical protein